MIHAISKENGIGRKPTQFTFTEIEQIRSNWVDILAVERYTSNWLHSLRLDIRTSIPMWASHSLPFRQYTLKCTLCVLQCAAIQKCASQMTFVSVFVQNSLVKANKKTAQKTMETEPMHLIDNTNASSYCLWCKLNFCSSALRQLSLERCHWHCQCIQWLFKTMVTAEIACI